MAGSIGFDSTQGGPAAIDYSVPLPGQVSGRRIVRLDLGLAANDFREEVRSGKGGFAAEAGIDRGPRGVTVDPGLAEAFLRRRLLGLGFDADSVREAVADLPSLLGEDPATPGERVERPQEEGPRRSESVRNDVVPVSLAVPTALAATRRDPVLGSPTALVQRFAAEALLGKVVVPGRTGGGAGTVVEVPPDEAADPQIFLVETYAVSSFLGSYGMGRTVRTFTLLPGESTTIRVRTWQSSTESIEKSSSIIDSHEQSAKERFADTVQHETTDKATSEQQKTWAVEAEASGSWGFGSASAKASASGEYHSAREQFSKSVSDSVAEHARDASSKRELSVSSSAESTSETGEESVVERRIENVNVRRVLNFVFRELNQEYTTKTHLRDVQVAFTTGLPNTWRQVPVSGMRTLLEEVLEPAKVDEVAQALLKVAGTVFAADETPVRTLEAVTYDPLTDTVDVAEVTPGSEGLLDPPAENRYYRLKRGPLAQDGHAHPVDGVLLTEQRIVMRTDSVIVEALLGEADALDSYAHEIQEAAARRDTLAASREELLLATVQGIADPAERVEAAARLLVPVPVAAGDGS